VITPTLEKKLHDRTPAFGISMVYDDPSVLESVGPGLDFVWVDTQHGSIGMERVKSIVRTCELIEATSLVRVAGHDRQTIAVVLDMDAGGVMVPQIDTPEQAREVIRAAKFPPVGDRSYAGLRVYVRRGPSFNQYANQRQLLVAQMESPQAIENADAIAAVDGVDVLMLSPDDLRLRLGVPLGPDLASPVLLEAGNTIAQAAKKHGKACLAIARDRESIHRFIEQGFTLIVVGADALFIKNGIDAVREVIAGL
jgi:4-hydroxy-2-oxoheptanedioate aldolase